MNVQVLQSIFQQKFGISLTPQELAELTTETDASGRSPVLPRQLHDLTLPPRADDPRPTFYQSNQVPRSWDTRTQHEFPRLMWSPSGQEVTIPAGKDAQAQQTAFEKRGYLHTPPADESPMDAIEREMRQLSDEDRQLVLEMQRKARMQRLEEKFAALSDEELATVGESKSVKAKK